MKVNIIVQLRGEMLGVVTYFLQRSTLILVAALGIRVILLLYGTWQDATSRVSTSHLCDQD